MKQFEVWLVVLDPTRGGEMSKTRPCVVVSPDEMNTLRTRIVAPLTSTVRQWRFRVQCHFEGVDGEIALDQLRSIDKTRGKRLLGQVDKATASQISKTLQDMFA